MPIPDIRRIETLIWVSNGERFVKSAGPRFVSEVAADFTRALEASGLSGLEYVSTRGYTDDAAARWPDGEVFVALQVGGSEGYSLGVYVLQHRALTIAKSETLIVQPIRAKLLCTRDDALAFHALAFHLLGS